MGLCLHHDQSHYHIDNGIATFIDNSTDNITLNKEYVYLQHTKASQPTRGVEGK